MSLKLDDASNVFVLKMFLVDIWLQMVVSKPGDTDYLQEYMGNMWSFFLICMYFV